MYDHFQLKLYYPDTRKTLHVYAMNLRLVEAPHLTLELVVSLRMGEFHNLIPQPSVMALAIYLVASWQIRQGKVTPA